MKIIGIEELDYTSKKSGNRVQGYKLYMTYEQEKVNGLACISEFVSKEVGLGVEVSDEVELLYNKFGQVTKIDIKTTNH